MDQALTENAMNEVLNKVRSDLDDEAMTIHVEKTRQRFMDTNTNTRGRKLDKTLLY